MSLLENYTEKFSTFPGEPIPSRKSMCYLVYKLKTIRSLLEKKADKKQTVLTEESLDNTGARLELHQEDLVKD
jgi:hypothetical protein